MKTVKSKIVLSVVAALVVVASVTPVVSAGYGFYVLDKSVRTGMIVSHNNSPGVVEPTSIINAKAMVGVVGNAMNDLDIQPGQIAVQTDGIVDTLVSTLEGDIVVGDQIGASSVTGIGSKNVSNGWIVGAAQGSFSKGTPGAVKTMVTDSRGGTHEVYVGSIPVLVKVTYYNPSQSSINQAQTTNQLPPKIQRIADSIAGKRASITAVILASLLLLIGFTMTGFIANSTVRNGIQSVARQPLAKSLIIHAMIRTILLAFSLLVATVVGSLLIMRFF